MKLEDQVAPLALARRMKELGFPQETFLGWDAYDGTPILVVRQSEAVLGIDWVPAEIECAAPTVAEMGEALPEGFDSGKWGRYRAGDDDLWGACARRKYGDQGDPSIWDAATEAEARARLWVALAEAGAIPLAPQPPRI